MTGDGSAGVGHPGRVDTSALGACQAQQPTSEAAGNRVDVDEAPDLGAYPHGGVHPEGGPVPTVMGYPRTHPSKTSTKRRLTKA